MRSVLTCAALVAAASLAPVAAANSVNIGFTRITTGNVENVASQMLAVVSDKGGGQVTFRLSNSAQIRSSISEVYYDNRGSSPLSALLLPLLQQGASFSAPGASPGNLPSGENLTPAFNANVAFSADASGNPSAGLDVATDYLEMRFQLAAGKTFNDVVSALNNGDLRLGLHVRSIGVGAGSDSFVSNGVAIVPLPPAAWAGGALLGLVAYGRVRSRR